MFTIWIIGTLFTDGLCDPRNEQGFLRGIARIFQWPVELGQWVYNHTSKGERHDR